MTSSTSSSIRFSVKSSDYNQSPDVRLDDISRYMKGQENARVVQTLSGSLIYPTHDHNHMHLKKCRFSHIHSQMTKHRRVRG